MSKTFAEDHNRLFSNLLNALTTDLTLISREANGGRSILFVYPHEQDNEYVEEGKRRLHDDKYTFIDIRAALSQFIESIGKDVFDENLENFGNEVYYSNNFRDGTFFGYLMDEIARVIESGKSPVLVHTGTLYNMGFSNINIMEDPIVLKSKYPLVVFYPASIEGETVLFLGKEPASRYRCIVIK